MRVISDSIMRGNYGQKCRSLFCTPVNVYLNFNIWRIPSWQKDNQIRISLFLAQNVNFEAYIASGHIVHILSTSNLRILYTCINCGIEMAYWQRYTPCFQKQSVCKVKKIFRNPKFAQICVNHVAIDTYINDRDHDYFNWCINQLNKSLLAFIDLLLYIKRIWGLDGPLILFCTSKKYWPSNIKTGYYHLHAARKKPTRDSNSYLFDWRIWSKSLLTHSAPFSSARGIKYKAGNQII